MQTKTNRELKSRTMWFPTSMKKKKQRKKTQDDTIFNIQNSKDKQKMRVKDDAIIKQVQIITTST